MTCRPGFVLIYCVLLVLALLVTVAAMLAVATREATIAAAHIQLLEGRAKAEAAARRAVATWSTREYADLGVGQARSRAADDAEDAHRAVVTVTRLNPLLFLVEAEATADEAAPAPASALPPIISRAALLLRVLDTESVPRSFPAAVTADADAHVRGGVISGRDACARPGASLPGLLAPTARVDDAEIDGDPPVLHAAPPPPSEHDPLAAGVVAAIADVTIELQAALTPAPRAVGGDCIPAPGNWGAISAVHPCHRLLPVVHAPGNLAVEGGEGRGILVVDGDLELGGDLAFVGLILVRGRFLVGPGARIRGAVRGHHIEVDGGDIALDRCVILAVLEAPALDRPLRPGERWWLPTL